MLQQATAAFAGTEVRARRLGPVRAEFHPLQRLGAVRAAARDPHAIARRRIRNEQTCLAVFGNAVALRAQCHNIYVERLIGGCHIWVLYRPWAPRVDLLRTYPQ